MFKLIEKKIYQKNFEKSLKKQSNPEQRRLISVRKAEEEEETKNKLSTFLCY
jgi:hypothetical protein